MQSPMTVTFRHIAPSRLLEAHAQTLSRSLDAVSDCITECHLTLEGPHGDSSTFFLARLDIGVPGAHIYADNVKMDGPSERDMLNAMQNAFDNATRQLAGLPNHWAPARQP